jgi:hypothetical protein
MTTARRGVGAPPAVLEHIMKFEPSAAQAASWCKVDEEVSESMFGSGGVQRAKDVFLRVATVWRKQTVGERVTGYVFDLSSYANHSCEPSCEIVGFKVIHGGVVLSDCGVVIRALRPLSPGEEVTEAYDDGPDERKKGSSAARSAALKEVFGFDCACKACWV